MKPDNRPGIENEPQYQATPHAPDPTEARTDKLFQGRQSAHSSPDAAAGESIWDEPTLNPILSGAPGEGAVTWASHLHRKQAETSDTTSLLVMLAVSLAAAPWAILGVFYYGHATFLFVVAVIFFAPFLEEILKVSVLTWVVEVKPWLFRHGYQVLFCGLAGGFFFGVLENLLYLYVYIPNPSTSIIIWRWTVCTALHTTCSGLAAVGLWRVWSQTIRTATRAHLPRALPWLLAAMILHGGYNALAYFVLDQFLVE